MIAKRILLAGLAVSGLAATTIPALAKEAQYGPSMPSADCFRSRDWENSRAGDDNTIYLGVRRHDVYRVKVLGGAHWINRPGYHLVSIVRGGSDMVCSPIDLDLKVADPGTSFRLPLFPVEVAKLTPAEIRALPREQLPISRALVPPG